MPDFTLPQTWVNPKNNEHVMLVAKKFQRLRYGPHPFREEPVMRKNGEVEFPLTNDFWLLPPTCRIMEDSGGKWRLAARYDTDEKLAPIVAALQKWAGSELYEVSIDGAKKVGEIVGRIASPGTDDIELEFDDNERHWFRYKDVRKL